MIFLCFFLLLPFATPDLRMFGQGFFYCFPYCLTVRQFTTTFAWEIVDNSLHGWKDGEALEGAQDSQHGAGVRVVLPEK